MENSKSISKIELKTKLSFDDIEFILHLIASLTPLYYNRDFPFLKEILSSQELLVLEKILRESQYHHFDLLLPSNDGSYFIKPDPMADLIRIRALKNSAIQYILFKLLPYFNSKLCNNISVLLDYVGIDCDLVWDYLIKMWNYLNKTEIKNVDGFSAIKTLMEVLGDKRKEELKSADVGLWIKSATNLIEEDPLDINDDIQSCLVRSVFIFQKVGLLLKAKTIVDFLRKAHITHDGIKPRFAEVIQMIAMDMSGQLSTSEVEEYLTELESLYYGSKDDSIGLTLLITYGNILNKLILTDSLVESKVDLIIEKYNSVAENLSPSYSLVISKVAILSQIIQYYIRVDRIEKIKSSLNELVPLYELLLQNGKDISFFIIPISQAVSYFGEHFDLTEMEKYFIILSRCINLNIDEVTWNLIKRPLQYRVLCYYEYKMFGQMQSATTDLQTYYLGQQKDSKLDSMLSQFWNELLNHHLFSLDHPGCKECLDKIRTLSNNFPHSYDYLLSICINDVLKAFSKSITLEEIYNYFYEFETLIPTDNTLIRPSQCQV